MTVRTLLDNLDDKVWDLFAKGYTATLNQTDGSWATEMVMQYKPRTLEELSMFTGAIRPNFASFRDNFINRIPQSTGSAELDEVLKQTNGQIIMQECLMQYFEWLNVSPADSIGLIKKISKKKIKPDDFKKLEANLRETWIQKVGNDDAFDITWNALQDQMSYGYCSAHACAVALDCLYCAYLKSHYPIEYYTVVLNIYTDDVEKTNRLCAEMKNFGISLSNAKFRHASSKYGYDKTNNTIYKSISSIKNIGKDTGDKLYDMGEMLSTKATFLDVLSTIDNNKVCNSRELEILISIGYFSEFGNPNQLLQIVELYNKYATAKVIKKDNLTQEEKQIVHKHCGKETEKQFREIDNIGLLTELINNVKIDTTKLEQVSYDLKYLGYSNLVFDTPYFGVEDIETNQYGTTYVKLYHISVGDSMTLKIDKKWFRQFTEEYNGKLEQGDIVDITTQPKPKKRKVDDDWVKMGEELVITAFCRK